MMDQWQDIAKRLRTEAPDRVLMLKGAIVIEAMAEELLAYEAANSKAGDEDARGSSWADFARQQAKRRIEAEAALADLQERFNQLHTIKDIHAEKRHEAETTLAKAVDGLKKLAEPPPDNPVGDPWNFYQDTVDYAAQVLVEIEAIRTLASSTPDRAIARWVKAAERQPAVGGSYITGKYVEDGTLPRRFEHSHDRFMIILNGEPKWFSRSVDHHDRVISREEDTPEYWLEGMPPHPDHGL